jgi:putative oxidoreductase
MTIQQITGIVLRVIAAVILLQTLWFKFSGHPESVALFTKLGVEPWGRIFTGVVELIAGILLLVRPTAIYGAFMAIGLMTGAIAAHVFIIGIESAGDGGQLFLLACVVLCTSVLAVFLYRKDLKKAGFIPNFIRRMA